MIKFRHSSALPATRTLLLALIISLTVGATSLARYDISISELIDYGYAWLCAQSMPMAFNQFRTAAARDANDVESRLMMGIIYQINGDHRRALEMWAEAENLGSIEAATLAGDLYFANSNLDKAQEAYQRVLDKHPETVKAIFGLALVAQVRGENDQAMAGMQKVIDLANNDPYYEMPQAYYHLGRLQLSAGLIPQAVKTLERGILLAPFDADMHLAIGQVYEAESSFLKAMHSYEYALHLNPELTPAEEGIKRVKTAQNLTDSED